MTGKLSLSHLGVWGVGAAHFRLERIKSDWKQHIKLKKVTLSVKLVIEWKR